MLDRLELLFKEKVNDIKSKTIMIIGLGGVGSYALEAIVRTGVNKVIIVDNVYVRTLFPRIVLNGESVEYVKKGEVYTEKGVTVIDGVDGNITDKVKIDGEVNSYQEGEYNLSEIWYNIN